MTNLTTKQTDKTVKECPRCHFPTYEKRKIVSYLDENDGRKTKESTNTWCTHCAYMKGDSL